MNPLKIVLDTLKLKSESELKKYILSKPHIELPTGETRIAFCESGIFLEYNSSGVDIEDYNFKACTRNRLSIVF